MLFSTSRIVDPQNTRFPGRVSSAAEGGQRGYHCGDLELIHRRSEVDLNSSGQQAGAVLGTDVSSERDGWSGAAAAQTGCAPRATAPKPIVARRLEVPV